MGIIVHEEKRKAASLLACRRGKAVYLATNLKILFNLNSNIYSSTTSSNKK